MTLAPRLRCRSARYRDSRRGTALVLFVLLAFTFFGFIALVVDIGYLGNARSELQRAADSAALAACWEYAFSRSEGDSNDIALASAQAAATAASQSNDVCNLAMQLDLADIKVGYLDDFNNRTAPLSFANSALFNAVEVTVHKNQTQNGRVPFFFARVFGVDGTDAQANATAAIVSSIRGVKIPSDNSNVDLLPFALDIETWNALVSGTTQERQQYGVEDNYSWNAKTKTISSVSDGVLEVNLYPKGNGSPGNRGTVDIGSSNNSTADIARQILQGISPADFEYHGGNLEFDINGELVLNGDTGISAGIKDELAAIKGQPRFIPIFSNVQGPGNNAMYTIVHFAGIRIMDVSLTGSKSKKHVTIQPAGVVVKGVIPSPQPGTSDHVYSPVFLVR